MKQLITGLLLAMLIFAGCAAPGGDDPGDTNPPVEPEPIPVTGIHLYNFDGLHEQVTYEYDENIDDKYLLVEFEPANATNRGIDFTLPIGGYVAVANTVENADGTVRVYLNTIDIGYGSPFYVISQDNPSVSDHLGFVVTGFKGSPEIMDAWLMLPDRIALTFNEKLDETTAGIIGNYTVVSDPSGAAIELTVTAAEYQLNPTPFDFYSEVSLVYLTLSAPIPAGELSIEVSGVTDIAGNAIDTATQKQEKYNAGDHGLTIDTDHVLFDSGILTFEAGAVDIASLAAEWQTKTFYMGVYPEGADPVASNRVAYGYVIVDGRLNVCWDNISGTKVFDDGTYDFYLYGHYDLDGDSGTKDDITRIMSNTPTTITLPLP